MIAIIDYDAGNLTSVQRAFQYLDVEAAITRDPNVIMNADKVVFPGVGNADAAMHSLGKYGLDWALRQALKRGVPILGICLGCQIILEHSQEGNTDCLGFIAGQNRRFNEKQTDGGRLKVPHMGWNTLRALIAHPILENVNKNAQFYFVHSYYPDPLDAKYIAGVSDYGVTFASVLARDNLVATQFHPEKSGAPGLQILANFARWEG
jgi:glutamine amidotransferase